MAPRFLEISFIFEHGERIPEHIEGLAGEGVRDPQLWHIDGYDRFDGQTYPVASDIETLEDAELLLRAARRSMKGWHDSYNFGGSKANDSAYLVSPKCERS